MKYAYPAIFTEEEVKGRGKVYVVEFPDIPGCATEGQSLPSAMALAREALAGCISAMQARHEEIPEATPMGALHPENGCVRLVII